MTCSDLFRPVLRTRRKTTPVHLFPRWSGLKTTWTGTGRAQETICPTCSGRNRSVGPVAARHIGHAFTACHVPAPSSDRWWTVTAPMRDDGDLRRILRLRVPARRGEEIIGAEAGLTSSVEWSESLREAPRDHSRTWVRIRRTKTSGLA